MFGFVSVYLLSSVDDILSVGQTVNAGSSNHRVVSRGGVGHFHGTELKEGLAQSHSAKQHLPENVRDKEKVTHKCPSAEYCIYNWNFKT